MENDEAYIAAKKVHIEESRAIAAAQDDERHAERLRQEEEARVRAAEEAEARAAAKVDSSAIIEDDGECHLEVKQLKKGDGKTAPVRGDYVYCTYTGVFAPGTTHAGKDYSGSQFDSTWDSKSKKHNPLHFQHFGGKAIRGWDEALKNMTLGEKVDIMIGPKWAYRKTGIQDDSGVYIVPPNAKLNFQMQLVGVRNEKLQDDSVNWRK